MRFSLVAALPFVALSTAGRGATPEEVVFSLSPSGAVRLPARINARGPFSLLLDTGSSHSTLSTELVDRLGLPVVAKARVSTPAGAQVQLVVRLEHMAIGNAGVEGLMPSIVSLDELRELEPGIDGVVGQDFLGSFDFTLDYRRKRLLWTAAPDDRHARLPLVRAGNRSLVELPGRGRGVSVLMVPDSGTEGFVIFERNGRTAINLEYPNQIVNVSALGMRQVAHGALLRELQIGDVTLRNQPAVVLAREGASGVEPDGLMPLHVFSRVSFKNSQGFMAVER